MSNGLLDYIRNIPQDISNALGYVGGQKDTFIKDYLTPKPQEIISPLASTQTPLDQYEQTVPAGTDLGTNYVKSQMPPSSQETPQDYYPALQDTGFTQGLSEADKKRQGLANLLLLIGFFESTLGRNSQNIFGVLPGGEGANKKMSFDSPSQALEYQMSPSVLGGGANPNMNILNSNKPLTKKDIKKLYESYDKNQRYLDLLLKILFPEKEGK